MSDPPVPLSDPRIVIYALREAADALEALGPKPTIQDLEDVEGHFLVARESLNDLKAIMREHEEVGLTTEPRIIHEIDPETGITSQRLEGPAIEVYRRDDQPPVELQTHGRTVQEVACDAADQFGMGYDDPQDCRIAVDGLVMQPTLPASDLPAGHYQLVVIGRRP